MASHQLAIAKASFSAGLLRPDPVSLSGDDIAKFHSLLNSAITKCSAQNVQNCKHWILNNVIPSATRSTALGKYLTALTNSFALSTRKEVKIEREPSTKRKRLHILYLLNDLLYHAKYRTSDASICSKVQPILVDLFGSAASFKACPKHQKKLADLLEIWEDKGYYSRDYITKLREAVKNGSELGNFAQAAATTSIATDQASTTKLAKSAPYIMPAMHGDPSTPWYDLPAGNLMPVIEPNSTRPINPDMIKPMQFVAGPASEELVTAVKALLNDVHTIYGTEAEDDEKSSWDIDELGQPIVLDEITGDILEGEGYYGWSRGFCEKMKLRKKGLDKPDRGKDRRRSRSRSRSSSRGRKRPYSDSESSPEGPRSRQRRRSYSSSRSPSPASARNGHSRPRSRDRSYSPANTRRPDPHSGEQQQYTREGLPPRPPPAMNQPPPPPPPQVPMPYQQGFQPSFPPPQHFNGPPPPPPYGWAPPPPPPMNFNQQNQWPVPPPPPPGPPPGNYQHQGSYPPPPPNAPGMYPPNGPGNWQGGDGRGYGNNQNHNNGWNNGQQQNRGGGYRGNYRGNGRGRGW